MIVPAEIVTWTWTGPNRVVTTAPVAVPSLSAEPEVVLEPVVLEPVPVVESVPEPEVVVEPDVVVELVPAPVAVEDPEVAAPTTATPLVPVDRASVAPPGVLKLKSSTRAKTVVTRAAMARFGIMQIAPGFSVESLAVDVASRDAEVLDRRGHGLHHLGGAAQVDLAGGDVGHEPLDRGRLSGSDRVVESSAAAPDQVMHRDAATSREGVEFAAEHEVEASSSGTGA